MFPTIDTLPAWPRGLPRVFRPLATFKEDPANRLHILDVLGMRQALRTRAKEDAIQCGQLTQTYTELFFVNTADYNAFNTSAAEGSLLAGLNKQPVIPPFTFDQGGRAAGRSISFLARGVLSNTGTPSITFQTRLGTTVGSTFLSGTSVGVSKAITTTSGVTNQWWELRLDLVCTVPGLGAGNTTLAGTGYVTSPGGFASPFLYPLEPTTPDTATWTATLDNSVTQFFNLSVTWSASSASNTITCKQLKGFCDN